jgi:tetratricopeptide (TPR) repeat protein
MPYNRYFCEHWPGAREHWDPSTLRLLIQSIISAFCIKVKGRYGEAEQMHDRALAGKEEALRPKHTSTLDTVNSLGFLYADQGKLEEAEQMYDRALARKEEALGPQHPAASKIRSNLSKILHRKDRIK